MFSVVNTVLLRPLPGYQTDRLVQIIETGRPGHNYLDPGLYLRLRETLRSFAPLSANQNCRMNLTGQGEPEQLLGPCTTADWFQMQGAQAMLGRTFLPDEDQHDRNHVVVLDHAFWQRKFGGDPKIVGRTIILDKEPWLVIGVMPPAFRPPGMGVQPQIYTAYVVADNPHGLNVTGRLKPGVSLAAAQAELNVAVTQLARQNPDWKELRLSASPLLAEITGPQRPMLLLLLGAVSLVLLIGCVNVANLMLARSAARRHEIEIRLALGATRLHIVRLVMAEAILIAAAGSTAALAIAYAGLRLLKPLTDGMPRADELAVDSHVLLWSLAMGIAAALLFGLLPAFRSVLPEGVAGMRSRQTARPHGLLVAGEVALAFVLLTGAGLLIQTLAAINAHDLGYYPQNVLTYFLALPPSADGSRTAGALLYAHIREELAALPGVRSVATASSLPMFGVSISMPVHREGEPQRQGQQAATMDVISDAYLATMGIPLQSGRNFTSADRDGSTPVAIVSESISSRYFGGKAIGKRIIIPEFKFNIDGGKDVAVEIVGVAGNVCQHSIADCQSEFVYLPETQNALRMENLLIRTAGDPKTALAAVRHAMMQAAPAIPLDDPQTLEERTGYLSRDSRRATWLLGVFAALALLLAAAGVYGVSAYLAVQRSREIGIRMALGASFGNIAALVYRAVLLPSALGLAVGGIAAAGLTRLLKSLLFGVAPYDPGTLALAGLTLLFVAVLAATSPALRAAWTDPATVLRRD